MKSIALIPVFDNLPFQWVGGSSMLKNVIHKLNESRDLDEIVVLTYDRDSTITELPPLDQLEIPLRLQKFHLSYATLLDVVTWFDDNANEGGEEVVYLAVDPLYPFLEPSRLEQALNHVLVGGKDTAITMLPEGSTLAIAKLLPGPPAVEACVAVHQKVLNTPADDGYYIGDYTGVAINSIEAINYRLECGQRMAQALEYAC